MKRKQRVCSGKTKYETKDAADRCLKRLVLKNGAFQDALNSYQCEDHWHVGHRPRTRDLAKRRIKR